MVLASGAKHIMWDAVLHGGKAIGDAFKGIKGPLWYATLWGNYLTHNNYLGLGRVLDNFDYLQFPDGNVPYSEILFAPGAANGMIVSDIASWLVDRCYGSKLKEREKTVKEVKEAYEAQKNQDLIALSNRRNPRNKEYILPEETPQIRALRARKDAEITALESCLDPDDPNYVMPDISGAISNLTEAKNHAVEILRARLNSPNPRQRITAEQYLEEVKRVHQDYKKDIQTERQNARTARILYKEAVEQIEERYASPLQQAIGEPQRFSESRRQLDDRYLQIYKQIDMDNPYPVGYRPLKTIAEGYMAYNILWAFGRTWNNFWGCLEGPPSGQSTFVDVSYYPITAIGTALTGVLMIVGIASWYRSAIKDAELHRLRIWKSDVANTLDWYNGSWIEDTVDWIGYKKNQIKSWRENKKTKQTNKKLQKTAAKSKDIETR